MKSIPKRGNAPLASFVHLNRTHVSNATLTRVEESMEQRLTAILAADVVGYSRLMETT